MVPSTSGSRQQIFNLLVLFRWLTLIPPLIDLIIEPGKGEYQWRYWFAFACAVLICIVISFFTFTLNRALIKRPWLLIFDLLLVAGLMAVTGGWRSPYYLYALNPLLAAAFFFQVRGAILATAAFLPLYFGAIYLDKILFAGDDPEWLIIVVSIVGSFLISAVLGYASLLLKQLQVAQDHLTQANRDLAVLHDLSTALQRSANLLEVQDQVLDAITQNLIFRRAVIGLVDQKRDIITKWRVQDAGQTDPEWLAPEQSISLSAESEPIIEALQNRQLRRLPRFETPGSSSLSRFGIGDCLLLPMTWGAQPIGVILVELGGKEGDSTELNALGAIARQTAVTLGMMMTRQRRARESAIQEERTRIALDLHDSISQSLFGLVYTLEACLKLLPDQPQAVQPELVWALATAEDVRQRIRATINDMWPSELTAQQFEADLRIYAEDVLHAADLDITFEIRGDFSSLSPPARRGIYRICQEGLSNIVQHAGASESRVCVDVAGGRARFLLRDDGRGFDPQVVSSKNFEGDHFGLRGMKERAAALGGSCGIYSQPAEGTSIVIDIPANTQEHHAVGAEVQDDSLSG